MKNLNKFTYVPGSKNKTDKILLFNNVAVAFEDVARMKTIYIHPQRDLEVLKCLKITLKKH